MIELLARRARLAPAALASAGERLSTASPAQAAHVGAHASQLMARRAPGRRTRGRVVATTPPRVTTLKRPGEPPAHVGVVRASDAHAAAWQPGTEVPQ